MEYQAYGFKHKRSRNYDGLGSSGSMHFGPWTNEPAAHREAQDMVMTNGYQWATYHEREEKPSGSKSRRS